MPTTSYFAETAVLPAGLASRARIEVADGRFRSVLADSSADQVDEYLPGITMPGFANTHSHAFHRALRGRTQNGGGSFWTWRHSMYGVAARLTPNNYRQLATAVFTEMVLAGITTVGEFHYVHHRPDGSRYEDPNAMGEALIDAAAQAGLRLTLLDTCYLAGGFGADGGYRPLSTEQRRFGDDDAAGWAARFNALQDRSAVRIGAAIHSVRAVPADQLAAVVATAAGRPLHVHLSEQPAENEDCRRVHGITPTALLQRAGGLGPLTTAVHATHLTDADIELLGASGTTVSLCPTTERDLADGIGPARRLAGTGVRLTVGSDQNAVVDLFEEARAVEMHERLTTGRRGVFTPAQLTEMLCGHESLGWPDAGRIEVGARADLVEIDRCSVRTAGVDAGQIVFGATAADVRTVVVDGRTVVRNGRHRLGDVGQLLDEAIGVVR
jgi:formiminoglutamate deiminase